MEAASNSSKKLHSNKEQPSWRERRESGCHIAVRDAQLHLLNAFFCDKLTIGQEHSAFRTRRGKLWSGVLKPQGLQLVLVPTSFCSQVLTGAFE